MYNIEIRARINQIIAVFYKFGMWRNEEETLFRETTRKLFYLMFYICFPISLLSGAYKTDNDDECIFLADVTIISVVMSVTFLYILWRKKEICAFIQEIGVHSIEDREVFMKINKKSKMFMQFVFCFIIMILVTVIVLFVPCLAVVSSVKRLPLNIAFPLDWKNSEIGYWMAYVFLLYEVKLSFVFTLLTILIWYLMLNCSIKFEVLGSQFRNIGVITTMTTETMTSKKKRKISEEQKQNLCQQELIRLIKAHQNIKETIARFRTCFANLFFVQIATSAMGICGSIYALVFSVDASFIQSEIYVAVLVYNLFDIMMVMYLGNEITLSSDRLSYCLFESNWIEQSHSCKKCFIVLMEVLKSPEELVICKLYPMNLETFTSILNGAYRMFNILQNIK